MTTTQPIYSARTSSSVRMLQSALLVCTLLFSSLVFSANISGLWKHAKQPVWIEIQMEQGDGFVVRNDKFPERAGNRFIKELKVDKSKQELWHALAYIQKLKDYKNVKISLSGDDLMLVTGKIGFISRTVEWQRVDEIPDPEKR
jgi:hypothetical protein